MNKIEQRLEKIREYYGSELYGEYLKEGELLKKVLEMLPMIPECFSVRVNMNTTSGVVDILICFVGRFIALELKRYNGVVSEQQLLFMHKVQSAGGIAEECKTLQQVLEALDKVNQ